ncbi:MAG: diheme cytochrome c [SAR324 cluster bacterium]|nr:diheme cytochrome c [SAR324 cluster bacterium]
MFEFQNIKQPRLYAEREQEEHDEHEEHEGGRGWFFFGGDHKNKQVPVPPNPTYQKECGSCHWAFLPGLLPVNSWKKLMSGLNSHFGDDASLDAETEGLISQYLLNNAAETSKARLSQKLFRGISNENPPLRITELPYIVKEHREIRPAIYERPAIKSFSNCIACHTGADQGIFNEHQIRIPK